MLIATGWRSSIVQELVRMLPEGEEARRGEAGPLIPLDAQRYVFAAGLHRPKPAQEQTSTEVWETMWVNAVSVIDSCDRIFAANEGARICVVGSEAAYVPSFDANYSAAKMVLHRYVETKCLGVNQQLVGVSPTVIEDSGMTRRRADRDQILAHAVGQRPRRWLRAREVARVIRFMLYEDEGYMSGVVVRLHGGPC